MYAKMDKQPKTNGDAAYTLQGVNAAEKKVTE